MKIKLILLSTSLLFASHHNTFADDSLAGSKLQDIQEEFKEADKLDKEAKAHFEKAEFYKKQKSIISDQNAYIRLNRRDAEKNYNNDFFHFINDGRTILEEKIEYRNKQKKKTLSFKELQKVLNKLNNSYGASLEISEIFTIEKAALDGKFDKKDATIKDNFWLAAQSWNRCKEISEEINETFIKMYTDEGYKRRDQLNKEADSLLSVISVSYTVGLTKIRDVRN